jgi:hypothetical protein
MLVKTEHPTILPASFWISVIKDEHTKRKIWLQYFGMVCSWTVRDVIDK